MRVSRIAVLVLALLGVSATVALAAASWETGDYRGKTEGKYFTKKGVLRQAKIGFHVGKHKITKMHYEMRVICPNGNKTSFVVAPSGFLSIDSNGKFNGSVTSPGGTGSDAISGKVSGNQASGTVHSHDREDNKHNEKKGGMKCDSGQVKWSAKKQTK